MAEKRVSLDGGNRDAVLIELCGKCFRIVRVVTGATRMWIDFLKEQAEYLQKVQDFEKQFGEAATLEQSRAIFQDVEAYADCKVDAMLQIIELLLTKNGHAFEREWWIENADERDYRDFISACVSLGKAGKKKTEEES